MKRKSQSSESEVKGQPKGKYTVPETNWALKMVKQINSGKAPPLSPEIMARIGDEITRLRAEGDIL